MSITLKQAQTAVQAAHEKAQNMGVKMNTAIVDAGEPTSSLLSAWMTPGSVHSTSPLKKAKTARFFDMPTGDIGMISQPGGSLYNIEHSNGGIITSPVAFP